LPVTDYSNIIHQILRRTAHDSCEIYLRSFVPRANEMSMATIQDIAEDIEKGNVKFHKREESNLFRYAVDAYNNKHFVASANLCATLYEKIFTTRLANETANPPGFAPSKDNVHEQLRNLLDREVEIIEKEKLSFRQITKQLS